MAGTIRESVNTMAGTTGLTLREAYDTLAANGAVISATKIVHEDVTVAAAATSGTATVVAGSKILGIYPVSNQDQHIDSVAIADTTLTVTLAAAATADNVFKVVVLEP